MPLYMPKTFPLLAVAAAALLGLAADLARAERADRNKPMVVESDGKESASVDLARKVTVVTGNVVVTQGTMQINADRIEVREDPPGRYQATARGAASKPALFRQKRDRVDEIMEGEAQRIEYDGSAERVRFIGNAKLRVLRNGAPSDEASAATIVYDQRSDTVVFEGGAPPSPGAAPGRARLVFVPRQDPAASEPEAPARPAAPAAPGGEPR
jgi:lipopolysaccharide export system protein LptA